MAVQYNTKCAGVKRLMKEASELREPTEMYYAQPLEDNLFEWHFTVRGAHDSEFENGIYHGRMVFPAEYPMKPPNMIFLTPNGRFELNRKICLSISGYHPETWLPSWSIRTALLALIGFLPTNGGGALGSLNYPTAERKRLARLSGDWECKTCCALMKNVLLPVTKDGNGDVAEKEEAKKLAAMLKFQDESDVKKSAAAAEEKLPEAKAEVTSESVPSAEAAEVATEEATAASTSFASPSEGADEAVAPEAAPSPPTLSPTTRRLQNSSTSDSTMFVLVPLLFVTISIVFILFTRRILLEPDADAKGF